ncbi:MAG: hypothetical protein LBF05_03980 [Tannerella sp.]|jgi:succinate-acetate transporter protein|nr:hypothetical protein [Tannerella sp.]
MEKDAEKVFRDLKEDLSTYAELKLELIKLNAYERISKVIAVFSYGLLLCALIFITIQFALLALGILLSNRFNSMAGGFGIIAALYFLQVAIVIYNKNRVCRMVINIIVSVLNTNEENNDATTTTPEESKQE